MKKVIYTFGYTLFKQGIDIDLNLLFNTLQKFNVNYLVDVRAVPYSAQYPQCNAENLKMMGRERRIPYVHMTELGAKADENQPVFSPACEIFPEDVFPIAKSSRPEKTELRADEEIVDFKKFCRNDIFITGLKRIEKAYQQNFTLALMCSEKDPLECHRYFLIGQSLEAKYGDFLTVQHLCAEGEVIRTVSNLELNLRLKKTVRDKSKIKKLGILDSSIFGLSSLDKYEGITGDEKLFDCCLRYWNLMHGWKRTSGLQGGRSLNKTFDSFNNDFRTLGYPRT